MEDVMKGQLPQVIYESVIFEIFITSVPVQKGFYSGFTIVQYKGDELMVR